ncbi:MAG: DUF484 family protein [Pseudomonadota bacterium]
MSSTAKPRVKSNANVNLPSEEAIATYLKQHPEFFDKHPRLLQSLTLPHEAGGTVSLVERQVASLRSNEITMKRKLNELVGLARRNDALASRIHALALAMLEATSLTETLTTLEERLRRSFSADQAVLVLFNHHAAFASVPKMRFVRQHGREEACLKPFATFLERGNPRCGQVRDSQRDFLFGADTDEIGSVALLPLGVDAEVGFLAIGSNNAEHFHPAMSVDFLQRIGQIISVALSRY